MNFVASIKGSLQRWWVTGAIVGSVAWLLSVFVFPKLPDINITFATVDIPIGQQGIPGFGETILNFLKLGDPTMGNFLTVVLSGIVLVVLGRFIYNIIPMGKTQYSRLSFVLLYGALLGTLILAGAAQFPWGTALMVMGIYYLIISIVTVTLAKLLNISIPQ